MGLLNTPHLSNGDGLYLAGAKSIHTVGMHVSIDVLFMDDAGRILQAAENIMPGEKRVKGPRGTRSTLELAAGTFKAYANPNLRHQTVRVIFPKQVLRDALDA